LLTTIFLLKSKNLDKLSNFDVYSYPNDILKGKNKDFIKEIIIGHEKEVQKIKNHNNLNNIKKTEKKAPCNEDYKLDQPIPQIINDKNIYTLCINNEMIIGLIFEKDDNPCDYRDIFIELSNEMLNNENFYSFDDETDIENFLISLFIDIRRYGDEYIEKKPLYLFKSIGFFIKVFLFGIDGVGKTSFVKRVKTGEYVDNYFAPTRTFNIEYVDKQQGQLAFWDMPGQRLFREKWLKGIQESNILIYMIDIANQLRFNEAKNELWEMLRRKELNGIPLIIAGNKVDLIEDVVINGKEKQLTTIEKEIIEYFNLNKIKDREWELILTSVKTNYNIEKVIDTIINLTR